MVAGEERDLHLCPSQPQVEKIARTRSTRKISILRKTLVALEKSIRRNRALGATMKFRMSGREGVRERCGGSELGNFAGRGRARARARARGTSSGQTGARRGLRKENVRERERQLTGIYGLVKIKKRPSGALEHGRACLLRLYFPVVCSRCRAARLRAILLTGGNAPSIRRAAHAL
jgi:hypothetical protein